jgi:hypothetical protein
MDPEPSVLPFPIFGLLAERCRYALMAWGAAEDALLEVDLLDGSLKGRVQIRMLLPADEPSLEDGRWLALDRFWLHLQTFLAFTANVSKFLWPVNDPPHRARGEALRRELAVGDDSPLKSRKLRDRFEHFDEDVDDWFAGPGDKVFVDRFVMPRGYPLVSTGQGPLGQANYFRGYDPRSRTASFQDKELVLGPVVDALLDLHRRAVEREKSRRVPLRRLPDPGPSPG